tara:strand:+ start:168 stop:446 length:279 start_codon:yes stop_codon:yes gene_type:complete
MSNIELQIKELIKNEISVFQINLIDDSYKHINHKKDTQGKHFRLLVVSDDFLPLDLMKRHQLLYKILGHMLKKEIHALSMKLLTREEYQKKI